MAIIVNFSAAPYPGAAYSIPYVKPGETQTSTFEIRAANGAVTFRTVALN